MDVHIAGLLLADEFREPVDDGEEVGGRFERAALSGVEVPEIHAGIDIFAHVAKRRDLVHGADLRQFAHGLRTDDEIAEIFGFYLVESGGESVFCAGKGVLAGLIALSAWVKDASHAAERAERVQRRGEIAHGIRRFFGFDGGKIDEIRRVDADLDGVFVAFRADLGGGRIREPYSSAEGIFVDIKSARTQPRGHFRGRSVPFRRKTFG